MESPVMAIAPRRLSAAVAFDPAAASPALIIATTSLTVLALDRSIVEEDPPTVRVIGPAATPFCCAAAQVRQSRRAREGGGQCAVADDLRGDGAEGLVSRQRVLNGSAAGGQHVLRGSRALIFVPPGHGGEGGLRAVLPAEDGLPLVLRVGQVQRLAQQRVDDLGFGGALVGRHAGADLRAGDALRPA